MDTAANWQRDKNFNYSLIEKYTEIIVFEPLRFISIYMSLPNGLRVCSSGVRLRCDIGKIANDSITLS